MKSLILDIAAVVIAVVFSYGLFWFKKHKTEIDQKALNGQFQAYVSEILGTMAENYVYDLKDSTDKGKAKKAEAMVKIKAALADAHLPVPSDAEISGAIEKAVAVMKSGDNNVKNG